LKGTELLSVSDYSLGKPGAYSWYTGKVVCICDVHVNALSCTNELAYAYPFFAVFEWAASQLQRAIASDLSLCQGRSRPLIDSEQVEDSAQFSLLVQEKGSLAHAALKYLVDTFTSAHIRARRKRKT
jgi:hypothetical protein